MAFLDKKEQVLEIILTKHGRKMLGRGKLRVKYYAFSDDEINYQVSEFSQFDQEAFVPIPAQSLLAENGDNLITEGGDSIILE